MILSELKYPGVGVMSDSEPFPGIEKFQICLKVSPSIATKYELNIELIISVILSPVISTKIDGFKTPLDLSS